MDSALTAAAFLLLITSGAYLIHRLKVQHAGRTAVHTHRRFPPGHRTRRRDRGTHKQAR
ncbi:hypothetical protein [Streptomyces sp. 900105245]